MTRAARTRGEWRPAATLPVARVAVDVALAHLDRPFDYRVPVHLDDGEAEAVVVFRVAGADHPEVGGPAPRDAKLTGRSLIGPRGDPR